MTYTRSGTPNAASNKNADNPPIARSLAVKRLLIIVGVLIVALIIVAATGLLILNALNGSRHDAAAVAGGAVVSALATVPGDSAYPIGMARAADGTLYLTAFGSGTIYKMAANGTLTPWLRAAPNTSGTKNGITAPAAITIAPDGTLYVIDFNTSKPGSAVGVIKNISSDGHISPYRYVPAEQTNQGLSFLSHLAFDDQANLYVTFTATGEVWRYPSSGQGTMWLKLPSVTINSAATVAQPTGIAFDKANHALVVADAASGTLYRATINADGSAGRPLVLFRQTDLALQGVTFDETGHLFLTAWQHDNGQLARLEPDGTYTLLAQSFREPSDVLAANGKLYVVNSDLIGLGPLLHPNPPFTVDVVTLKT